MANSKKMDKFGSRPMNEGLKPNKKGIKPHQGLNKPKPPQGGTGQSNKNK